MYREPFLNTPEIMTRGQNYSRSDVIPRSSGLKQMACSVARRNYSAISRQVMSNPKTRDFCLMILAKDIQKDLTRVASVRRGASCLHHKTLQSFTWEKLLMELKVKREVRV